MSSKRVEPRKSGRKASEPRVPKVSHKYDTDSDSSTNGESPVRTRSKSRAPKRSSKTDVSLTADERVGGKDATRKRPSRPSKRSESSSSEPAVKSPEASTDPKPVEPLKTTRVPSDPVEYRIKLPFNISEEVRSKAAKLFPGVLLDTPLVDKTFSPIQSHPLLAIERRIAEDFVYRKVRNYPLIIDVGGNPIRHFTLGHTPVGATTDLEGTGFVWSCCPVAEVQDAVRNSQFTAFFESFGDTAFCTHFVNECDCVPAPDVYMSVHSLYYLSQLQILELLLRCKSHTLWAVVHRFNGTKGVYHRGDFYGEAHWERYLNAEGQSMIRMKMTNSIEHGYQHLACDWLHEQSFTDPDYGSMVWATCTTLPTCDVVCFSLCNVPVPPRIQTTYSDMVSLMSQDAYGQVDVRGIMTTHKLSRSLYEQCQLETYHFVTVGSLILAFSDQFSPKTVYIPKDAISATILALLGDDPNRLSYNTALGSAKVALRSLPLTSTEMADAAPIVAVLAMSRRLEQENQALQWYSSKTQMTSRIYESLRSFKPVLNVSLNWRTVLLGSLALGCFAGSIYVSYKLARGFASLPKSIGGLLTAVWHGKPFITPTTLPNTSGRPVVTFSNFWSKWLDFEPLASSGNSTSVPSVGVASVGSTYVVDSNDVLSGATARSLSPVYVPSDSSITLVSNTTGIPISAPIDIPAGNIVSDVVYGPNGNLLGVLVEERPDIIAPGSVINMLWQFFESHLHGVREFGKSFYRKLIGLIPRFRTAEVVNHAPIVVDDVCMAERVLVPMHATAKVCVLDALPTCQPGFGLLQAGPALIHRRPCMPRSCVHNDLVAVHNRACLDRARPATGFWLRMYKFVIDNSLLWRHPGARGIVHPYNIKSWLARFPETRRRVLLKEKKDWDERPQNWSLVTQCKAFIKKEKTLKMFEDKFEEFDPRLIQGRSGPYQFMTGPWTLAFSNFLKKAWHAELLHQFPWTVIYAGGMNAREIGQWMEDAIVLVGLPKPIFFENDFARFDATNGTESLTFEFNIYSHFYRCRILARCFREQLRTHGVTSNGVRYEIEATVKSGDGNTTCGNTLRNGTTQAACCVEFKIERFSVAVIGDDAIGVLPSDINVPGFVEHNRRFFVDSGFRAETQVFWSIYDAEFCSARFWPSSRGLILGPKIGRVFSKTFWSEKLMKPDDIPAYVRGIALGMVRDVNHIPVLRVLMHKILELTKGVKAQPIIEPNKIHVDVPGEAISETFAMCEHLYGVSRARIVELEEWLDNHLTQITCTISHPTLALICDVDVPSKEDECPKRSTFLQYGSVFSDPGFLSICVLGPIVEEVLKHDVHTAEVAVPGIVIFEGLVWFSVGQLYTYLPTAVMHYLCATLPLVPAILLHGTWNATVYLMKKSLSGSVFSAANQLFRAWQPRSSQVPPVKNPLIPTLATSMNAKAHLQKTVETLRALRQETEQVNQRNAKANQTANARGPTPTRSRQQVPTKTQVQAPKGDSEPVGPRVRPRRLDEGSLGRPGQTRFLPVALSSKTVAMGGAPPDDDALPYRNSVVKAIRSGQGHPLAPMVKHNSPRVMAETTETPVQTKYGPGWLLSGSEYITGLQAPSGGNDRGDIVFMLPITPKAFPSTRIESLSKLFTRFIFRRIELEYRPTTSMTSAGALMGFCDYDPTENPSFLGADVVRVAYAHVGAQEVAVYEHGRITVGSQNYEDLLYIEMQDDLRWCVQGQFWLIAASGISASLEYGNLMMHYEIEFAVPNVPISSFTSSFETVATLTAFAVTIGTPVSLTTSFFSPILANPSSTNGQVYVMVVSTITGTWPAMGTMSAAHQVGRTLTIVPGCCIYLMPYLGPNGNSYMIALNMASSDYLGVLQWTASGNVTATMSGRVYPTSFP